MSEGQLGLAAAVELFVAQLRSTAPVGAREFGARFPHLAPDLLEALEAAEDLESLRAPAHERDVEALESLGPYRFESEIGRGGMGVVMRALEAPLGRTVALKLLPRALLTSASARVRFHREAVLASRLDHPGICTVYGAGVTDGQPWIAMRLLEGRSLSDVIAKARESRREAVELPGAPALDASRAVALCIARVARALAFAHARGVLHRDVKPSNVIVTNDGQPVLLDFGVAIESETDTPGLTRTGETAGTPAYLAPELIAGERARPDERCDVYALGVTLYECLALRPPFAAPTRDSLYRAILTGAPSDVRRTNRSVARDLAVIVATALERDPQRRYHSAAALADDLEAFVAGRSIAARPAGPTERIARWARREPRQATLAVALSIAALSAAVAGGMLIASREDVRAGQLAQRERELETALVDAYTALGNVGDKSAASRFAAILKLDPGNPEAEVGLIFARLRALQLDDAKRLLRDAPTTAAFDRLRAMAERRPAPPEDANWLESASAFELFVDGEALRQDSERLAVSERPRVWRVALARFDDAVARAPQARAIYHQMRAWTASQLGEDVATRSACRALVTLWPDSAWSLYQAGSALGTLDPERALRLLRRSAELDPSRAATFQCIGMAHYNLGQLEEAKPPLLRALELNPLDALAQNGLAVVQMRLGCVDEARAALYATLSINPRAIQAWGNLTVLSSDRAETVRFAEHVLDIDPGQSAYRAIYGQALLDAGQFTAARDQFARLVVESPKNALYWNAYASSLANAGELETGLHAVQISRSIDPSIKWVADFELQLRAALGLGG